MSAMFYTKRGLLTRYALACGFAFVQVEVSP